MTPHLNLNACGILDGAEVKDELVSARPVLAAEEDRVVL